MLFLGLFIMSETKTDNIKDKKLTIKCKLEELKDVWINKFENQEDV